MYKTYQNSTAKSTTQIFFASRNCTILKMNILHVTTFLQGGAGKVIVDLAKAFSKLGHSISVACTKDPVQGYGNYPEHLETLEQDKIPLIFLDSTFSRVLAKNLHASRTLHSSIIQGYPDLIHSHSSIPSMVGIDATAKLNKEIPIIQTMHGWGINKTKEQERQDIEILNSVNHVVSVSKSSENLLLEKEILNKNKSVIYNGVETTLSKIEVSEDKHLLKLKSLRKEGKKIIGVIGTVDARKNQALILEALALLPNNLEFHAFFVGEGEDLNAYREKTEKLELSSKVTFTGYKKVARLYTKESDLLISASVSEGAAPIVILEAFSEKTLVLASDTQENMEAINDGYNGYLFRSGNAASLSEKINISLSSRSITKIKNNAFDYFQSKYTLKSMIENYLSLYLKLTDSNELIS